MGAVGTVLVGLSSILAIRASPPGAVGNRAPNSPQLADNSLMPLFFFFNSFIFLEHR